MSDVVASLIFWPALFAFLMGRYAYRRALPANNRAIASIRETGGPTRDRLSVEWRVRGILIGAVALYCGLGLAFGLLVAGTIIGIARLLGV
jgi:hypothetical protein